MTTAKEEMAELKTDIKYLVKSIDRVEKKVDEHFTQCDTKYSGKWVEKTVVGVIIALAGTLGTVIALAI